MDEIELLIDYVSVIIPVYNDQIGVNACLAALAVQSYPKDRYEVIVVDNASKPSISVAPEYSFFTRLVVCHTQGSYAARNAGIAVAQGEVLAFTDADCVPERNWISTGVAALRGGEGDCVIGGEVALLLPKRPTAVARYQHLEGFMQRENIEDRAFSVTANIFTSKTQNAR
ncbi:MAG: glycosyltransferase, partial [Halothiobacillus sp.]|nr:glycosyltransferase [Halothiobacillus sp.]